MENPLVPASYDPAWTVASFAVLALIVTAVALLVARSRRRSREIAALRSDVEELKRRLPEE